MAYGDYGAYVYRNGIRMKDREDTEVFLGSDVLAHGVMGDGDVRVACYKQGLPTILHLVDDGKVENISLGEDIDIFDYGTVSFEYMGYYFEFVCDKPYYAKMVEPSGVTWECKYDYWFGAGFDDEED